MRYFLLSIFFMAATCGMAFAQNCPAAMADFCGDAGDAVGGRYSMTFKKFEISQDGTNFVTIGEGDTDINIADINVGSSFGAFASNTDIPAGTYTHMRITLARQQTLKGRSADQDPTAGELYYYTTDDKGPAGPFHLAGIATGWDAANNLPIGGDAAYEAIGFDMPDDAADHAPPGESMQLTATDMIVTTTLPVALTIDATSNETLVFKPHTGNMIGFSAVGGGQYAWMPMPPQSDID
jgi:hypothetical protein